MLLKVAQFTTKIYYLNYLADSYHNVHHTCIYWHMQSMSLPSISACKVLLALSENLQVFFTCTCFFTYLFHACKLHARGILKYMKCSCNASRPMPCTVVKGNLFVLQWKVTIFSILYSYIILLIRIIYEKPFHGSSSPVYSCINISISSCQVQMLKVVKMLDIYTLYMFLIVDICIQVHNLMKTSKH